MANQGILTLPDAAALDGTEYFPINQGGNSRRANLLSRILAYILPNTRVIPFFFTTTPTASEILGIYGVATAFTLPANLAGTIVGVGTNPSATFAIDVQRQVNATGAFSSIGTISISTSGVPTLSTAGGTAKALAVNDILKFVAPGTADTTIANVAINVKGSS